MLLFPIYFDFDSSIFGMCVVFSIENISFNIKT